MTKNDMARVIVQALYLCDSLPGPAQPSVVREAKATLPAVTERYRLALRILKEASRG